MNLIFPNARYQMKNLLLIGTIVLVFFFAVSPVRAQDQVIATATAEVIEALSTQEINQLNFGRFSPETQGGKIILTPDGVRTAEGTVALAGGTHNSATFYITGQYEATFSINLPPGPAVLTNPETGKTILVSEWQSSPAPGISAGKLLGGGVVVSIGASLIIGDMTANPVGIYAGTYTVTFPYD
jgi:hypothetical protein